MSYNEIAISVHGLKKSYNNIPVLAGVDFQVKTGGAGHAVVLSTG